MLTDAEIEQHSRTLLGGLRAFLLYENALLGLHEEKEFAFSDVGEPTYPDEAEEARAEEALNEQVGAEKREVREIKILKAKTPRKRKKS